MSDVAPPRLFRFDTHVHTSEASPCARVPAREVVRLYREAGYDGIVVTDHFNESCFRNYGVTSWSAVCDRYLSGYRAALEEGIRVGLVVIPGMEVTFEVGGYADFLVYGLNPERLYDYPELHKLGLRRFRMLISGLGCLVIQAHPFRPGIELADPALLDGVEVFNGNPRHFSANHKAADFAAEHGLLALSGSDFHQREDLARGGVLLQECPTDSAGFVRLLKSGKGPELIETP